MSAATPVLITPKEAASLLGIDRKRIYTLVDRGAITAYDLNQGRGNRWLVVDKASVVAFLQSCMIKPTEKVNDLVRPLYA